MLNRLEVARSTIATSTLNFLGNASLFARTFFKSFFYRNDDFDNVFARKFFKAFSYRNDDIDNVEAEESHIEDFNVNEELNFFRATEDRILISRENVEGFSALGLLLLLAGSVVMFFSRLTYLGIVPAWAEIVGLCGIALAVSSNAFNPIQRAIMRVFPSESLKSEIETLGLEQTINHNVDPNAEPELVEKLSQVLESANDPNVRLHILKWEAEFTQLRVTRDEAQRTNMDEAFLNAQAADIVNDPELRKSLVANNK